MTSPSLAETEPDRSVRRRSLSTETYELRVSAYDNVSAWLLALLVLVGVTVFCLLVIWLTNQIFVTRTAVPVELQEISGGRQDGVVGESMEIDSPNPEEVALESDLVEPQVRDTLAMLTEAIALEEVDLDDAAESEELESSGGGRATGDGRAVPFGDGGEGAGLSRAARWQIFFQDGGTIDSYAQQLDFFGIELAVVGGDAEIIYATNLAASAPRRRTAPGADEDRLYMSWRQPSRRAVDRQLLRRAGIDDAGRLIVQFYPPDVENALAVLERDFAGRKPEQITRTSFGVRSTGGGYEFFVIDQIPR